MPSFQAKIVKKILKIIRYSWAKGSIDQQRLRQEKTASRFRPPMDVVFKPFNINGISAEWIMCPEPNEGLVLYLHGGAFALGSINSHREYLGRFASATRAKVLAINYRLAPEYPFPAALEDSLCAYDWLMSQGTESSSVVIAGDSAGGGLALSTILALRDAGEPLPCCAVCISPWIALTLSSKSIRSKASADPLLSFDILAPYAGQYAGDYEMNQYLISPFYSNLESFSPLLIHVDTDEILLDEAIQFSEKAKTAGVDVVLETWEGMFHVFQVIPFLPETKLSLDHIAKFISSHLEKALTLIYLWYSYKSLLHLILESEKIKLRTITKNLTYKPITIFIPSRIAINVSSSTFPIA